MRCIVNGPCGRLGFVLFGLVVVVSAARAQEETKPESASADVQTEPKAESNAETKSDEQPSVEPALGGYCPACYLTDRKAIVGKPEYQTEFRGRIYYHSSEERKKQFEKEPDKYLPRFDGLCTMALGGNYGNRIPGDPQVFTIEGENYYLFSSLRAYRAYHENPEQFRLVAHDRFDRPLLNGYCPVAYQQHGRAVKGQIEYAAVYDGRLYYLMDAFHKSLFDRDPYRYVPWYYGHDPVSLADQVKVKGNPTIFVVDDRRTFLFVNEKNKEQFERITEAIIRRATAAWAEFKDD